MLQIQGQYEGVNNISKPYPLTANEIQSKAPKHGWAKLKTEGHIMSQSWRHGILCHQFSPNWWIEMTFNQGWLSPPQAISVMSKNITGNQALRTGHYFDLWVKVEKDRKHPSFGGQPRDSPAHSSPETYGNILLYKVNAVLMEFQQPPLKTVN